eukprot:jgi/Tetstr1/436148/TSEL_024995.t2
MEGAAPRTRRRGGWLAARSIPALLPPVAALLLALASAQLPPNQDTAQPWTKPFPDAPELLSYDSGQEIDEAMYERYQTRRLQDLSAFLERVQEQLKQGKLRVGIRSADRPEMGPIKGAFKKLGAKVTGWTKRQEQADPALPTRFDLLVTYAYQPRRMFDRLAAGNHTLVVEKAYLRGKIKGATHQSYSWDGVNNRGLHPAGDPRRWAALGRSLRPQAWRVRSGCPRTVVLLGQERFDRTQFPIRRRFGSSAAFMQYMVDQLRAKGPPDLKILFRAHPEEVAKTNGKYSKPKGAVDATKAGYEATLAKADVVVTGNSGAGVEAMLKGIPVLAGDPGFMAWQCSLHRVEDLFDMRLRDHDACFHQILTSQWSNADIGRGALRYILDPINYRPERQRPPPIVRNATCTDEARGPAGLTVSEPILQTMAPVRSPFEAQSTCEEVGEAPEEEKAVKPGVGAGSKTLMAIVFILWAGQPDAPVTELHALPRGTKPSFRRKFKLFSQQQVPKVVKGRGTKFMMCTMPKNGCSQWKRLILKVMGAGKSVYLDSDKPDRTVHNPRRFHPLHRYSQKSIDEMLRDQQMPRVALVRNPYARVLSAYQDKILNSDGRRWRFIKHLGLKTGEPTFEEFVVALWRWQQTHEKGLRVQSGIDHHFALQSSMCGLSQDTSTDLSYDYVLKVEETNQWYTPLVNKLNLTEYVDSGWPGKRCFFSPPDAPCDGQRMDDTGHFTSVDWDRHSTGAAATLANAYTPVALKLVTELYAEDIAAFGYPKMTLPLQSV